MKNSIFQKQADLLISLLPYITKGTDFALHGGTAINFFLRNMPRLSVDLDLRFLPVLPRADTLRKVNSQMELISGRITKNIPGIEIVKKITGEGTTSKLFVKLKDAVVKIESNLVIRGSVFACQEKSICEKAQDYFEKFASVRIGAFGDLYGAKICAALDRQHPRDLFDAMLLLDNEGLTEEIRKAFIVYLISHNCPISEILSPNFHNIRPVFEQEFSGMTSVEVSCTQLEETREQLLTLIIRGLTPEERAFIFSFKGKKPRWELLGLDNTHMLPAVKWKMRNLEKMDKQKHASALDKLEIILAG